MASGGGAVSGEVTVVQDFKRTHFYSEGITLSQDGGMMLLGYADPDQGGTRLYFRYIISPYASPRMATGYTGPGVGPESEIAFRELPKDVVEDACAWLENNTKVAREGGQLRSPLYRMLARYLECLTEGKPRAGAQGDDCPH